MVADLPCVQKLWIKFVIHHRVGKILTGWKVFWGNRIDDATHYSALNIRSTKYMLYCLFPVLHHVLCNLLPVLLFWPFCFPSRRLSCAISSIPVAFCSFFVCSAPADRIISRRTANTRKQIDTHPTWSNNMSLCISRHWSSRKRAKRSLPDQPIRSWNSN